MTDTNTDSIPTDLSPDTEVHRPMRRHLSLTLTALFVVASGTTLGVATATASTAAPLAGPHTSVKIAQGSACKPASTYCFKKATKTVASGTKVTWNNPTIAPHTITRCTPAACAGVDGGTGTEAGLGSSTLTSGGKYKFVFHGTGTYSYYCAIHGYGVMHGTVTVTP
jgi:plastocyanin